MTPDTDSRQNLVNIGAVQTAYAQKESCKPNGGCRERGERNQHQKEHVVTRFTGIAASHGANQYRTEEQANDYGGNFQKDHDKREDAQYGMTLARLGFVVQSGGHDGSGKRTGVTLPG